MIKPTARGIFVRGLAAVVLMASFNLEVWADDDYAMVEVRQTSSTAGILEDGLKVNVSHVDVSWNTHWTVSGTRYAVSWYYTRYGGWRTHYVAVPRHEVLIDSSSAALWVNKARSDLEVGLKDQAKQNGINLVLVDQSHIAQRLDERDLEVAGITESSPRRRKTKQLSPDLKIYADVKIDVKLETGTRNTVSGIFSVYRFCGWRYRTRVNIAPRQKIRRVITFSANFTAEDTRTGEIWVSHAASWQPVDTANPGRFFGSSKHTIDFAQTDDQLIMAFFNREVPNFIAKLTPMQRTVSIYVEASGDRDCKRGVSRLRVHDYRGALAAFQAAIVDDDDDEKALFGAGVAAEKIGDATLAAAYYQQAIEHGDQEDLAKYRAALARVSQR